MTRVIRENKHNDHVRRQSCTPCASHADTVRQGPNATTDHVASSTRSTGFVVACEGAAGSEACCPATASNAGIFKIRSDRQWSVFARLASTARCECTALLSNARSHLCKYTDFTQEARQMSKSLSRVSTTRPTKKSQHQPRLAPLAAAKSSPGSSIVQNYGQDTLGNAHNQKAVVPNAISAHKRALIETTRSSRDHIHSPKQGNQHVLEPKEVKPSLNPSFIQESDGRNARSSATKPTIRSSDIARAVLPDFKSSVPSVDRTDVSAKKVNASPATYGAGTTLLDDSPHGHVNAARAEQSQSGLIALKEQSNRKENMVKTKSWGKDTALGLPSTASQFSTADDYAAREDTKRKLFSTVENLQYRVNKLEEERERRYFLGSKTPAEPFTVDVLCRESEASPIAYSHTNRTFRERLLRQDTDILSDVWSRPNSPYPVQSWT
nr:hypothetical protein CFP56_64596 [Quercus suber]